MHDVPIPWNGGQPGLLLKRQTKSEKEAIHLQPDDAEAYFIRGAAHTDLGRYENAIADLETALELAQAAGVDDLAAIIEEALEAVRNP